MLEHCREAVASMTGVPSGWTMTGGSTAAPTHGWSPGTGVMGGRRVRT
jgi:hypothetical protein